MEHTSSRSALLCKKPRANKRSSHLFGLRLAPLSHLSPLIIKGILFHWQGRQGQTFTFASPLDLVCLSGWQRLLRQDRQDFVCSISLWSHFETSKMMYWTLPNKIAKGFRLKAFIIKSNFLILLFCTLIWALVFHSGSDHAVWGYI